MNVASLELCRELYKISDWFDTYAKYYELDRIPALLPSITIGNEPPGVHQLVMKAPAYDLGYLLRKLPRTLSDRRGIEHQLIIANGNTAATNWCADYIAWGLGNPSSWYVREVLHIEPKNTDGDTPEDAACKLAIELFKAGVLKHE